MCCCLSKGRLIRRGEEVKGRVKEVENISTLGGWVGVVVGGFACVSVGLGGCVCSWVCRRGGRG